MRKNQTDTFVKWSTVVVAIGGLILGIVNLVQNRELRSTDKALKVEQFIAEANDLIYFGGGNYVIKESISSRKLELVSRKINEILIIDPDNVDGLMLAAICQFAKGSIDDSINYLKKVIRLDSSIANSYLLLGRALAQKKQHAEAVKQFKNAIGTDPGMTAAYSALGKSFYQMKMYEQSTQSFEKAAEMGPESPEVHYNLAYIYYFQGKLERARNEFCKVVELDSDYPRVNDILERLVYYQGKISNLNEYDIDRACPRPPAPPKVTTPFIVDTQTNEATGKIETRLMWKNLATGELKPIGEW